MKNIIVILFISAALVSCQKFTDVNPNVPKDNTSIKTPTGVLTPIKLDIADQVVYTSVSHDTLYLKYTETVTFILNPDDYKKSSAVRFKEDFSKSILANYSFTNVNNGQISTDYLHDNLNNVTLKSASTVTIEGVKYTKLVLERDIKFSKAYKQTGLASEAQKNVLTKTADVISFSSYYYINNKNSDVTQAIAKVIYK